MPPKRRRRFQGLYYHSSPPKVLPMNGQSSNQGRKRRDIDDFSVKLSTIRIWMHEKDIGKLTRILWAGQGSRLCQQASTNPRVKRFLAAVPYVMNSIKDVHQAVIDNNLETLQAKMESPVPPALITCRDANGLNLIHKAAGLGHTKILEYLIGIWPDGAAETDITGKTPLHWAASHKNNMRCYTLLTEAGCDEEALDYKMKSPTYYRHKPHEIERAFLVYVPEAPRVSPDVATDWEALSEDIGDGGKKLDIKIPDTNGFHGRNTDDSIENTSEVDLNDGVSATDEEPQTAAITNGNGDDSAPQTPAEDDEEAANGAEEGGEEEPALTNGAAETNDVNGHDGAEVDVEVEDTEAAKAEAAVDADAEAEAQADVGADIKADVEADAQANPEVEATEAETNMKALNHTTTTKTNGNEEHAEQKESEAASTAVNDNKDTAESEIAENGTKIEESGETEKVEERKEESEDITNEESESNVKEVDDVKDEEQPKTAEVVDNTEDETKENESNVKEKDEMKDEDKPKTAEKKDIVNTEDETKENEVKENEIESETTNTEGKIEDTKVSDLSIEPHIESGDAHTEEYKEQTPMGEEEQQQKEAQAEATNGDEEENKAAEVQQVGEQVADHKSESEVNELELNVNNAVDETAPADTTEAVKDIVKEVSEDVDTKKEVLEELKKEREENEDKNKSLNGKNKESDSDIKVSETEILDNGNEREETTSKSVIEEDESKDNDEEVQKDKETEKDEAKETLEHVSLEYKEDNIEKDEKSATENEKEIALEAIEAKESKDSTENAEEKTNLSDEKEEMKANEVINSESNESKIEKDEENKDTTNGDNTKSVQPDTTVKDSPESSSEKNDGEKSTQEAPNANDKTEEEEVSNKTKQEIVENNEKTTTTETDSIEKVLPQNGGLEVTSEQYCKETGENMSKEKLETIDEHAISKGEQVGGKIPRLTTAKLSRGKRNGSAKRSGSGKKKTDALVEGENESDGEYDEDDEDEQKDEHENENEAATDSENETNNGYESDNEPAVDTASEHEAESEADENDDEVQVVTEPQTADKLDENHNEAKYDNGDGASSPTSSLAIEGFVTGASEDNRVQSQSAAYVHEVLTLSIQQSDIREAIEAGDMEQLAQIVLNGDGKKLVNMHSHNPDIQAFLSNVPNYMSKIRRVHEAAREGSLLALQQALDRRKFAIAKDDISPNGATPLHVAVLFGNTDIVRYLAARFPETTTITDNDGRTALHYAATINDNGHFYNVLTQLGANSKALDKLGHTPEFYQNKDEAKDILNYKQLLSNFGAEELEDELLNDQVPDDLHSSRRQLQDVDINRTLDRCFSVIEESSKALSGSAASALAHRKPLTASTLQVSVISYLSRFLKRSVFEKIRLRQTRLDHNLFDVIWPSMRKTSKVRLLEEDISCGIIAPDFDVYVVFQEFLVPLIKDMHCMSVNEDFKPHPRIAFFPMENAVRLNTAAFIFDDESNLIQRCTVECSRNLEDFELPVNLTIGQVEQAERMIMGKIFTNHFVEAIGETESGSYYTLTEILEEDSEIYATLQKLGLLIPLLDMKDTVQGAESLAFNGSLWPYGRGVYINSANNLALWLNCQEHLRVISTSSDANAANMGVAYTRVGRVISFLERELHFKESYFLGYLQARPAYLGTGLKFTTTINLPNLMKEVDNLRHLCSVRGLNLITCATSKSDVQLVNMQSLGVIEYVLFQDYCTAVTNIVSLEKDMSLTNSKHIASMLVKIFRRKKNSLVERN
ncbi:uncharacterized protein LOC126756511 isoform X14 [Bactrocera neohumeralis]|uniref:uncharacterized protein LOC126756511 isoform X14 n=1 Tax=Bactrocera neohumeralis TaxID=98809 RepID=UPI00216502E8|nr:uncharacterized protein LOC126756511 isoform X14 [Bactrocera neohumeralis]